MRQKSRSGAPPGRPAYSPPMSFDVAAEAYDRFMGRYSRLLSPQMADLAGVAAGQRVVDVGCGPGALTAELVARVGAGHVAAVDPSAPFVDAARERNPGVDVRLASAEELPFPDAAFDAAIAQLVVHFMADPVGGQGPLGLFWDAAHSMDPGVADESRLAGAREGHLKSLFEAAGLRDIESTVVIADLQLASFDEWWEPFTGGVGPAGAYVAGLSPDRQVALRERCRAALPSGAFTLTARAWAARGVVPRR